MRCEQAREQLFDYADDTLPELRRAALAEHLESCSSCREDYEGIVDLALKASVWHDLPAPRWQPPRVGSSVSLDGIREWFPSLASAAALLLVLGLYLKPAAVEPGVTAPGAAGPVAGTVPAAGVIPAGMNIDTLLSNNRLERQQELQALVQLLRAEMDRRSEETEESLRYVIAHQLQGQREIDDLYQYLRKVGADGAAPPGARLPAAPREEQM